MRMPVMEDRNSIFTRMKYSLESAAHAQKRFDRCKQEWHRPGEERPCGRKEILPLLDGDYYIIRVWTGMFPMSPPVWFARKKLRQDQIAYLDNVIREQKEQENK